MVFGEVIIRLFKVCLISCLLCFPAWLPSHAQAQSALDAKIRRVYYERVGDRLYDTREVPHNLELAIQNYKEALKAYPQQPGVNWKISRCYWVLANRAVDEVERSQFFKQGINHSKLAVELDKENSNAYLWYSLTAGSQALDRGVMNTLYMRDELKTSLETALKLNPENVNALLGLAGWNFYVPALFGGDKTKTFNLINQALKIDPNYTAILIQKAEMLIAEKRYPEATDALQKLLKIKNPTLPGDGREDKAKARVLLKVIEKEG